MDEDTLNNIEENLQEIPQEVQNFIFGDGMKKVMMEISELLGNNSKEKDHIKNDIIFFLLGASPIEEMTAYIDSLTATVEVKNMIKTTIQEKIFDELQLLMEVNEEMDQEDTITTITSPGITKTHPSDILSRLSQTLITPTTLAPTKRDLSADSIKDIGPSTPKSAPSIDPYRELPEK